MKPKKKSKPSVKRLNAKLFKSEVTAYMKVCEGFNTPRSLACFMLAQAGEWDQLINLEISPDNYFSVSKFKDDHLVTSLMAKNPRLPLDIDREAVALDKFQSAEIWCKMTNRRLTLSSHGQSCPRETRLFRKLMQARKLIAKVLGPLSSTDLNFVEKSMRFGPGATTAVRGIDVVPSNKYAQLSSTTRLSDVVSKIPPNLWWEAAGRIFTCCDMSRLQFVPKNAKTDRTICTEPHLNIFYQLGVGKLLRKKLRKIGINLNDQAELNSFLAQKAYEWGLATIDLSAASDTIARVLVELLLPERWVHLLYLGRTDTTMLKDGERIHLEKWSSMGNGYTFELETLIFWALSQVAAGSGELVYAYGDDIICPQRHANAVVELLEFSGFRVNEEKSFLSGCFFESCGTDWFLGEDVRPVYFRAEVKSQEDLTDAQILNANQLRRYSHSEMGGYDYCDVRFLPSWLVFYNQTARSERLHIPDHQGDGGFIENLDRATPTWSRDLQSWRCKQRTRKLKTRTPRSPEGYLLACTHRKEHIAPTEWLARIPIWYSYKADLTTFPEIPTFTIRNKGSRGKLNVSVRFFHETLRGRMGIAQHTWLTTCSWPNLGPWL